MRTLFRLTEISNIPMTIRIFSQMLYPPSHAPLIQVQYRKRDIITINPKGDIEEQHKIWYTIPKEIKDIELVHYFDTRGPFLVCPLKHRELFVVSGNGAKSLLQSLITNNLDYLEHKPVLFTYALNAKGRIEFEFLIYRYTKILGYLSEKEKESMAHTDENYVIECDYRWKNDLIKHFKTYMLRRKLNFIQLPQVYVHHSYPFPCLQVNSNIYKVFSDPRNKMIGSRMLSIKPELADVLDLIPTTCTQYRDYLNYHAIPEGPVSIEQGKFTALEFNGDLMNAISLTKGCYLGQELTTRAYYTGKIRKRLLPIRLTIYNRSMMIYPYMEIVDTHDLNYKKVGKIVSFNNVLQSGMCLIDFETMAVHNRIPGIRIPPKTIEQIAVYPPVWWNYDQLHLYEFKKQINARHDVHPLVIISGEGASRLDEVDGIDDVRDIVLDHGQDKFDKGNF